MAAILRLTITADIKGYCPIGHLQTSVISDVGLIGHPSFMLWSIDTKNKVSANQYHVTILRAHVESSSRSAVFFKLTADQVLVSNWIAGSSPAKTRLDAASTSSSKHLYSSLRSTLLVFRWKKPIFPAFSAVLIENRLDIIVYGFAREKIVWFGKVLIMQALSSDVVLNWTVLPLKILN